VRRLAAVSAHGVELMNVHAERNRLRRRACALVARCAGAPPPAPAAPPGGGGHFGRYSTHFKKILEPAQALAVVA
jgi:hypothetical protein